MKRLFLAILLLVSVQMMLGASPPFETQKESVKTFVQVENNSTIEAVVMSLELKASIVQSSEIQKVDLIEVNSFIELDTLRELRIQKLKERFREADYVFNEVYLKELKLFKERIPILEELAIKINKRKTLKYSSGNHKEPDIVFIC